MIINNKQSIADAVEYNTHRRDECRNYAVTTVDIINTQYQ